MAILGAVALAGAPAYGQTGGVSNVGDASARTGNNSSAGNASTNSASNSSSASANDPVLGGLVGLVLNLGTTSANNSGGTSAVNTGGAQASGNNSSTGVGQTSGGAGPVGTVLGSVQAAGVSNSGDGSASTGGNASAGNASTNQASNNMSVNGGLIAVGLSLGQNATNNSTGTSGINTGTASAAGNQSTTEVAQVRAGGGVACDGSFRFSGQRVDVGNDGVAIASTGSNSGVGNQSRNSASNSSTVNGGLIAVNAAGLLSSNASNSSDGTSAINTGTASASGNRSTTEVAQQCGRPAAFVSPPVIVPGAAARIPAQPARELARTGVDPFVLGLAAFALLFGGFLFMVWERVEALPRGRSPLT